MEKNSKELQVMSPKCGAPNEDRDDVKDAAITAVQL
jgi:hypothetical protein